MLQFFKPPSIAMLQRQKRIARLVKKASVVLFLASIVAILAVLHDESPQNWTFAFCTLVACSALLFGHFYWWCSRTLKRIDIVLAKHAAA